MYQDDVLSHIPYVLCDKGISRCIRGENSRSGVLCCSETSMGLPEVELRLSHGNYLFLIPLRPARYTKMTPIRFVEDLIPGEKRDPFTAPTM